MGASGYKIYELFKEHQAVDMFWREKACNYWSRFIHDVKEKGFGIKLNDKNKTIDVLKENKKILSLHFNNEMLKEDVPIRYSIELIDKYLFEEIEKGEEVRYNGKDWKVLGIIGNWIRIETISGEKNIKIHKDVLIKQNPKEK